MKIDEVLALAKDSMTVRRVYAEPVERDGTTVIAAADVVGGGGGGENTDENRNHRSGGGFGLRAKPVGAFVITDGHVCWRPAVDVNRLVTVVGAVGIVALILAERARARRGR